VIGRGSTLSPRVSELLREAADASGVALEVETVEVTSDEDAARLGFAGSPTYLLAGRDPFPREEDGAVQTPDACRAYARPGGRIGPLPHVDDLAAALREASGGDGYHLVLDPLWSEPAKAAIATLVPFGRLVNIGQSAGAEASLDSAAIRSRPVDVLGYTNYTALEERKAAA
jgi:hypothetical protein